MLSCEFVSYKMHQAEYVIEVEGSIEESFGGLLRQFECGFLVSPEHLGGRSLDEERFAGDREQLVDDESLPAIGMSVF